MDAGGRALEKADGGRGVRWRHLEARVSLVYRDGPALVAPVEEGGADGECGPGFCSGFSDSGVRGWAGQWMYA